MKKAVCFILCLILVFSLSGIAFAEEKPSVSIKTEDELATFLSGNNDIYEKAVLENDITVKENYSPGNLSCLLDGKGHSIILKNKSTALISEITEDAKIQNLIIDGKIGNKSGKAAVGICVENNGTVENCAVIADISGKDALYGICQTNNGNIYNCAVLSEPDTDTSYFWIPIAAENNGDITACYYIADYVKDIEVEGRGLTKSECKNGKLLSELNARVDANENMMRWNGKNRHYPGFDADHSDNSPIIKVIIITLTVLTVVSVIICFMIYRRKSNKYSSIL